MNKKNADKLADEFAEWMVRVCMAVDQSALVRAGKVWFPEQNLLSEIKRRMSKRIMELDNE